MTQCYCTSLRAAARRVTSAYDDALAPAGVNAAQFALLRKLGESSPLPIKQLADKTDLERSTVARNVRVLQRHGLVDLGSLAADRRATVISLSDRGQQALAEGEALWDEAQRAFEGRLGVQHAAALRRTLQRL